MPRQGARGRRLTASRRSKAAPEEADKSPATAAVVSRPQAGGQAADFEAILAAPGDTAEKLFELANKPAVRFSIGGKRVEVAQDRAATEHSGGVVWETAFFLARYVEQFVLPDLRSKGCQKSSTRLRSIELGSGCGLLGLSLSHLGFEVLLTEQPTALANLRANVKAHRAANAGCGPVKAAQLSWGDEADIAAVASHGPFDLVIASDVVFATRFVDPLLHTISSLFKVSKSQPGSSPACWLCLQQRDPDAHAALLAQAPTLFRVRELSFDGLPGFEAASELECAILHLRPLGKRKKSAAEAATEAEVEEEEVEAPKTREATKAPKDKKRRKDA